MPNEATRAATFLLSFGQLRRVLWLLDGRLCRLHGLSALRGLPVTASGPTLALVLSSGSSFFSSSFSRCLNKPQLSTLTAFEQQTARRSLPSGSYPSGTAGPATAAEAARSAACTSRP